MKLGRWVDHLPLWLALGAVISTGIYDPEEVALMALPLVAGAAVDLLRWDLARYRRWLEIGALVFFIGDLMRGRGIFPVAIHMLFLLGGVRLILPRELPQRRQLLLMGFLLLLTAAVSTTDLAFFGWCLAWLIAAAMALLQQSWETSASQRRGPAQPPPYSQVPLWAGGALLFGTLFFMVLPRVSLGLRPVPFLGFSSAFGQAGLSESLNLMGKGPIQENPEVVLRITPAAGLDPSRLWEGGPALLRGLALESVQGNRWEPSDLTPDLQPHSFFVERRSAPTRTAEFFFAPSRHAILPLPYSLGELQNPPLPLRSGAGGSLRWGFPTPRALPLQVVWFSGGEPAMKEFQLSPRRTALLTRLGPEHEAARRWSFKLAPQILQAPALARALERALQGWRYTLDNPSGSASNPLEDFLDRTQAGHCEYFASTMTLMLRARGVPARVVNGYRVGPWIPEGGYFRVSQDQAHSWVEYWDQGLWHVADPTPSSLLIAGDGAEALGFFRRWADAIRYRWDRHVVRFSDDDQQAGVGWLRERLQGWSWHWRPPRRETTWALALAGLAYGLWRTRNVWRPASPGPGAIRALRPLLASTRRLAPPLAGETARAWLLRLAVLRPDRLEALTRLADAVDTDTYGQGQGTASALAKAEAVVWRKGPTSR